MRLVSGQDIFQESESIVFGCDEPPNKLGGWQCSEQRPK
jgi:hypothetical protein